MTAIVAVEKLASKVLDWRGEQADGLKVVREGVKELRSGMREGLSLLKGLEVNAQTLGNKADFIQDHVRGVPRVLADLREAQVDPKSHALHLYRKFKSALSNEEIQIYDAVQRAGSNKAALPELKAKGLVRSEAVLSRKMREIRKKLSEFEGVVLTGIGPGQRYGQVTVYDKETNEAQKETVDSKQEALSKWADDEEGRVDTIRQYLAADDETQEFYRSHYPDIEAEAMAWKEKRPRKMKSK